MGQCWGTSFSVYIWIYVFTKEKSKCKIVRIEIFLRLLSMYWIFLVIVIVPIFLLSRSAYSVRRIIKLFAVIGVAYGLNHLWYVWHILLCYLITPSLQNIYSKRGEWKTTLILFLLSEVITNVWINCYILSFAMGKINRNLDSRCNYKASLLVIIGIMLMMNSIQIVTDYVLGIEFTGITVWLYGMWKNYTHVFLGATIFLWCWNF